MEKSQLNILFLGGSKRVSMARMFKAALDKEGVSGSIFSYEMDAHVPVACEGEIIIGKRWSDEDVYAHLDSVVDEKNISIIVPFVDGAVGVAAEYATRYPGKVFVPCNHDRTLTESMFDKVKAAEIFSWHGLPVPATYTPGDPCLRLIAKPRNGSASKGIIEINSLEALERILLDADSYLIQERIDNRDEFSVDCYVGVSSGEILALSPRKRLEVTGGEASRTVTIDNPEIAELTALTLKKTGLRGAVTVQLLSDRDTDRIMLMEINPRLGGGCVCSVHAGADIPRLIVREAIGREDSFMAATPGVEIARYMQEVIFYPEQK